ncbi:MAG: hypothetical protein ACRC6E_07205 [Fusobacteriaceae bacterium]
MIRNKYIKKVEMELNYKIIRELESIEEIDIPQIIKNIKGLVK